MRMRVPGAIKRGGWARVGRMICGCELEGNISITNLVLGLPLP